MAEAGSVVVDGKRTTINFHTGVVTATRKQKETQISSSTQYHGNQAYTSTSSSTVDHHELFIVDSSGRERAFQMIDMDLAVREGNTVTVVWVVPEGSEVGPHILVQNHNTGDRTVVAPKRILSWFMKPKLIVWGSTAALVIVSMMISWVLVIIAAFAPFLYFRRRAMTAIKGMFASPELKQLEAQLGQVKPAAAVAA
jgi:hypothetical protein